MIIAIDGPAGSGKSTIAREVAKQLDMRHVDTGAMYRAITLLALEAGLVPDRIPEAESLAAATSLRFEQQDSDLKRVFIGDREITGEIRGPEVSRAVSPVSADPGVRRVLTAWQRAEAARGNVVLEGRDMGTVVVPQAELKIYLTASIHERARRRQLQNAEKGVNQSIDELVADITARDAYDSGREHAPLCKAADAVEIDTTDMTIPQVIAAICALARERDTVRARWPLSRLIRSPLDTRLYRFAYWLIPPLWRLIFRLAIVGQHNIPSAGPVVIASNHRSNLDPFFLGIAVPRQIHFLAKIELWKVGLLGRLVEALGALPVSRGAADREAVRNALSVLEQGAVLGLFPEGHRYRGGGLGEINPGVTLFSLRDGITSIPVYMEGTDRVFRRGLLRFPKVTVTFGPPVQMPDDRLARSKRVELARESVVEALESLSGHGSTCQ
jgi:cytidylate kinase